MTDAMELKITYPYTSEVIVLEINSLENDDETVYKISFIDKSYSENYGTIELIKKPDNFWKFPDNVNQFLMSMLSETIFQIMNNEVTS